MSRTAVAAASGLKLVGDGHSVPVRRRTAGSTNRPRLIRADPGRALCTAAEAPEISLMQAWLGWLLCGERMRELPI
ncbi:hypothetical protein [Cryobacterium ruanii]|uniref:hypothetical protein n=1 Tax=Cryobacterium ruanii TaxID=1259197 RepID=UPI001A7E80E3|nr:hypothetical protein [Cryobacterium ruanii]